MDIKIVSTMHGTFADTTVTISAEQAYEDGYVAEALAKFMVAVEAVAPRRLTIWQRLKLLFRGAA